MTDVLAATEEQQQTWYEAWVARLNEEYARDGGTMYATGLADGWTRAAQRFSGAITAEGVDVGRLAVTLTVDQVGEPLGFLTDIWIDPAHRRQGHGRAARQWAEAWIRPHARRVAARVRPDPAAQALFASYPVRFQRMAKPVTGEPVLPAGVRSRPMTDEEYPAWVQNDIVGYAADLADSGTLRADQAATQSPVEYAEMLPDGLATAGYDLRVVEADGRPVAAILIGTSRDPNLSFVYSVEVRPQERGRGYGRAAMQLAEQVALAGGARYLGLNVFGHNRVAINLYESLGYQLLEQTRIVEFA